MPTWQPEFGGDPAVKTFKRDERVLRKETGEKGVVRHQFMDGYVALTFDDGRLAELADSSLKRLPRNTNRTRRHSSKAD